MTVKPEARIPALRALRRDVHERGLDDNVLFVGYLDRRDALLDCYRAANVFTFASRTELAGARGAIVVDEDLDRFAAAQRTRHPLTKK